MVGQNLNLFSQSLAVETLERLDDPRMECTAALHGHAVVRHLVRQRMLERVFGLGKAGALVQKLRRLKFHEVMNDLVFGRLDAGLQEP